MKKLDVAEKFKNPKKNLLMEIAALAKQTDGLIDLSLGDPDVTTDVSIIEASMTDALAGHTHYTAANGSAEFLQTVADFYQKYYELNFQTTQIRATVGALHGMFLAFQAILNPGDEVIVHEPYFSPYIDQIIAAGGVPVIVPTFEEDGFQLKQKLLEKALTSKTKIIVINSPNNPTGSVFSASTMKQIADIAIANNLFIFSDEVYEAFSFEIPFVPMATFAPENTITFSSFSKAFAMTGWRIGYMISPTHVNDVLKQINESVTYSAPTPSQQAGIYALKNYDTLVSNTYQLFKERIKYIEKRVAMIPFLSLAPVKGGIYAFINIEKTGLTSVAFTEKLLNEAKVLVVPGEAFGKSGSNHIRVAATQDTLVLEKAFDLIEKMDFSL